MKRKINYMKKQKTKRLVKYNTCTQTYIVTYSIHLYYSRDVMSATTIEISATTKDFMQTKLSKH